MSETVIREEILNKAAVDYPRMVIMADSLKLENNRNEVMKALTEIVMLRNKTSTDLYYDEMKELRDENEALRKQVEDLKQELEATDEARYEAVRFEHE